MEPKVQRRSDTRKDEGLLEAARRALQRVEKKWQYKAWCSDVIGPALEEVMDDIHEKAKQERAAEEESENEYRMYFQRKIQEEAWRREDRQRVTGNLTKPFAKGAGQKRTVVIGGNRNRTRAEKPILSSSTDQQETSPKQILPPTVDNTYSSRNMDNTVEETSKPILPPMPTERRLRKIDILAEEEEGVPLPPTGRQSQAFRLARPTNWAQLKRDVLQEESFVAPRHDPGPRVEDDLDDAPFLTHQDWERRLAEAPSRRQAQQQPVQHEHDQTSTLFGTIKTWATGLWSKVKMALWG